MSPHEKEVLALAAKVEQLQNESKRQHVKLDSQCLTTMMEKMG